MRYHPDDTNTLLDQDGSVAATTRTNVLELQVGLPNYDRCRACDQVEPATEESACRQTRIATAPVSTHQVLSHIYVAGAAGDGKGLTRARLACTTERRTRYRPMMEPFTIVRVHVRGPGTNAVGAASVDFVSEALCTENEQWFLQGMRK